MRIVGYSLVYGLIMFSPLAVLLIFYMDFLIGDPKAGSWSTALGMLMAFFGGGWFAANVVWFAWHCDRVRWESEKPHRVYQAMAQGRDAPCESEYLRN